MHKKVYRRARGNEAKFSFQFIPSLLARIVAKKNLELRRAAEEGKRERIGAAENGFAGAIVCIRSLSSAVS